MLAAVEQQSIPTCPGPDQKEWRCCKCANMLGVVWRGWLFMRHKGRFTVSSLPAVTQCEGCGRRNVKHAEC
jgi:hypothetical protein